TRESWSVRSGRPSSSRSRRRYAVLSPSRCLLPGWTKICNTLLQSICRLCPCHTATLHATCTLISVVAKCGRRHHNSERLVSRTILWTDCRVGVSPTPTARLVFSITDNLPTPDGANYRVLDDCRCLPRSPFEHCFPQRGRAFCSKLFFGVHYYFRHFDHHLESQYNCVVAISKSLHFGCEDQRACEAL